MRHQSLQLRLGPVGRKVGDLRFEGDHQVGSGIHNGCTEIEDPAGVTPHRVRKLRRFGVQPHTQKGAVLALGGAQLVKKFHGAYCREAL